MGFINKIFDMVIDFTYFFRAELSFKTRIMLLLNYFKILFKYMVFGNTFKSETIMGRKITSSNYSSIYILFNELYFRNTYFFKTDKKSPLILDAGANIGMATVYFKQLYPKSDIHCFEPDLDAYNLLIKNTENLNNVHCHNTGLSYKEETVTFYYNKDKPGDLNSSTIKRIESPDVKKVKMIKLSSFIKQNLAGKKIDLLKMDIEGDEHKVLDDLISSGEIKNVNQIILEYHHYLDKNKSLVGKFIQKLELEDYDISLFTINFRLDKEKNPQNIFIRAKKISKKSRI